MTVLTFCIYIIKTIVWVLRGATPWDGGDLLGVPGRAPRLLLLLSYRAVAVADLLCPGNSSQLPLSLPSCVLFRKIKLLFQCPMMNVIRSPHLTYPWITFKYVTANQAVINLSQ